MAIPSANCRSNLRDQLRFGRHRGSLDGATGHYWRSEKTYEVIKAIQPPVLMANDEANTSNVFWFARAAKEVIEQPVQFTGKLAAAIDA